MVSNAGVINTLFHLLPPEVAEQSPMYGLVNRSQVVPSTACLQVFVGLRGTASDLGLKAQNVWAYPSTKYNRDVQHFFSLDPHDAIDCTPPVAFISMNGAKDPTFTERFPNKSTIVIIGFCNQDWFKTWEDERVNKRGAEYDDLKEQLGQSLWRVVLSVYPHLEDKVEYFEVGTSLTNDFYLGTRHGEMYGLDHDLKRFGDPEVVMNLRPNSGIKGLYLAGQDMFTDGYVGALVGGALSTVDILKRNIFDDVERLGRQIKKLK